MRGLIVIVVVVAGLAINLVGIWAHRCGYRAGVEAGVLQGRLEANRQHLRFLDELEAKLKGAK